MEHQGTVLKIGHRGRPGNPRQGENTIHSFEVAIGIGAQALEFDVRKTKDGRLVVIHDLDIARTTNGRGKVCDLSYEELSKFDAAPGESIPLFSEVLDMFGGKCLLNIELKESGIEGAVKTEIISRELDKLPYHQSVIVSAFDQKDNDSDASSSWNQLKVFVPDISIALLATASKIQKIGESGFVKKAKEYKARAINPEDAGVTSSLVNLAHKEGLLVYVWTVNDPKEIERLKKLGVDGLFSDFVERL